MIGQAKASTAVEFLNCRAIDWNTILAQITNISSISSVTIIGCQLGDYALQPLVQMVGLSHLDLGKYVKEQRKQSANEFLCVQLHLPNVHS